MAKPAALDGANCCRLVGVLACGLTYLSAAERC